MKKILITGAAGMIGSHLADCLLEKGFQVVGIDDLSVGKLENIKHNFSNNNFSFHKVDILDFRTLNSAGKDADTIFHLAAKKKIGENGYRFDVLMVNTKGTENVLEIAKNSKAKVIFGSSSDVYGMTPSLPMKEDDDLLLGPSMIKRWSYAVSKLYGEQLCFAYLKKYQVPVVVLRYFGAFSPRASFTWTSGHIPLFIDAILKDEPVIIHGNGTQTRSMGYVSDLVAGTILAAENDSGTGEIINVGSSEEMSIVDSAYLIKDLVNKLGGFKRELKIKWTPFEAVFGKYRDIARRVPDLTKAKFLLGYEPKVSLREGLTMTISKRMEEGSLLFSGDSADKR